MSGVTRWADLDGGLAVLDASIAVRWIVDEAGSPLANEVMQRPRQWLAPRLLVIETANALRRKVGEAAITATAAEHSLAALLSAAARNVIALVDDEEFVVDALRIALSDAHKLPDCMYVALAARSGAPLATADVRMAELSRARGIATYLLPTP